MQWWNVKFEKDYLSVNMGCKIVHIFFLWNFWQTLTNLAKPSLSKSAIDGLFRQIMSINAMADFNIDLWGENLSNSTKVCQFRTQLLNFCQMSTSVPIWWIHLPPFHLFHIFWVELGAGREEGGKSLARRRHGWILVSADLKEAMSRLAHTSLVL